MRTTTTSLASPVLNLNAPAAAPLTRALFAAPKYDAPSLLEMVQAMDGNKEARYYIALDALTLAYTQAITYGDKRQLNAMLKAEGKGKCVTAMRNAVRMTGVMGLQKDGDKRADVIANAVSMASALFIDALTVKKAKAVKPLKAEGAGEGAGEAPATTPQATELDHATVMLYAATLDDAALTALLDGLAGIVAKCVNVRMPMLQAA